MLLLFPLISEPAPQQEEREEMDEHVRVTKKGSDTPGPLHSRTCTVPAETHNTCPSDVLSHQQKE